MRPNLLASVLSAVPVIAGALILMYSDLQSVKSTKADTREVLEMKIEIKSELAAQRECIINMKNSIDGLVRRFDERYK